MTITDIQMLPMADHVRGKRSAVTCHYKCANACLGPECNTSANPHFRDIASAALTRRALFGLGAASAVGIALAAATPSGSATAAPGGAAIGEGGLAFDAIAPVSNLVDDFNVPEGYTWEPIIRWGDPLFSSVPALDFDNQTAEAQAGQFGYNCDYLDIIADTERPHRRAREQSRVREPGHHVPAEQRHRRARPSRRNLQGRPRLLGRRAPAQQDRPAVALPRRRSTEPPHHRRHGVRGHGPGCGQRPHEDGRRPRGPLDQGHARQLRGRHHPVGHGALG